jgi:hypothetical protein
LLRWHGNMLVAEVSVSHRTPFIKLGYGHVLFILSGHDLFGSLLVTILIGGVSLCILSPLLNLFVWRKISYWLCLVMVLWLKPMVPWRNQGPPMNVHTWMRYLARPGITVSIHNPLWDYIDMLSLHKLFLPREILYWCQFCNYVMIKALWCRSETESPLWMYMQGYAAWRMRVSRSLVMIHYRTTLICYLPWTFPWDNFYVVCQVIRQHLSFLFDQKGIPLLCVVSFLLILVVTTHTSFLYILCVKVKPWRFLVLKEKWLVLKMKICFPCCCVAGVVHALWINQCIL